MTSGTQVQPSDYRQWLGEIKSRFRRLQIKAAVAVNAELLQFYWQMGADIAAQQAEQRWGSGFLQRLSQDLMREFPQVKGFSLRNLKYIRQWHAFWQVTLPLLRPIIFFLTVMATIGLLSMFNQPYMLTKGGPRGETETLMLRLYNIGIGGMRYGDASAFGFMIGLLVIIISAIQIRLQRHWIG